MISNLLQKLKFFIKLTYINLNYKNLSDKEIFEKIYREKEWNKSSENMNSGPGSHDFNLISPYIKFVQEFLNKNPNLKIIDIGCGDFNIGKKIFESSKSYIGIDIVENLIKANSINFVHEKLNFICLNIIEEKIPKADCVIARQVFQHLDNYSISIILNKIKSFKYAIITEHIPDEYFVPNIDKLTGPNTRLYSKSGVDIERDPFDFQFKFKKELIVDDEKFGGLHKTVIYTLR